MKGVPLADHDRRKDEEAYESSQREEAEVPKLFILACVLAALGALGTAGDWYIAYYVFQSLLEPVPGEGSGAAIIMAFSSMLAATCFHIYTALNPDNFAAKLLNRIVGWLALLFCCALALMAMREIFHSADVPFFGVNDSADNFLSDSNEPQGESILDQIISIVFGIAVAGLALINFWLLQVIAPKLRKLFEDIHNRKTLAHTARSHMKEINECEGQLAKLEAERQSFLREFEPAASFAHASKLAALIEEARAPIRDAISVYKFTRKPPESIFDDKPHPDIDFQKLEKNFLASNIDAKTIYAAFSGPDEGKKRS